MEIQALLQALPWQNLLEHAPLLSILFFASSFAGIGAMLILGRSLAKRRKRTSYDKCAKQLAALATFFCLLFLLVTKGLAFWHTGNFYPENIADYCFHILWLLFALTMFFLICILLTWKLLQKRPLLQSMLG